MPSTVDSRVEHNATSAMAITHSIQNRVLHYMRSPVGEADSILKDLRNLHQVLGENIHHMHKLDALGTQDVISLEDANILFQADIKPYLIKGIVVTPSPDGPHGLAITSGAYDDGVARYHTPIGEDKPIIVLTKAGQQRLRDIIAR